MKQQKMKPRTSKPTSKPVKKVTKTVVTTVTTTTTTTGQLKNRIGIILDSSSSMEPMRDEVISAFNGQVATILQNNKDMDTKVSLLTFSTEVHEYKILNQPVFSLKSISRADYEPNGWTALYDAIGKMTDYFMNLPEANDPSCSFLMVIVSDGEENKSRFWNYQAVQARIQALEANGRWTFTYLGANDGLKNVASTLGIRAGNTISGQSLRSAGVYASVSSNSMKSFMKSRAGGQSAVASFYSPDPTDPVDPNATTTTTTTTTVPDPKVKAGNS
jgi:hypothetical protein